MAYVITDSNRRGKRYVVMPVNGGKPIHFGSSEYDNYTIHRDDTRKLRYLQRHQSEDWEDLTKAGTWARYILWNKRTIAQSVKDMEDTFGIRIVIL